LTPYCCVTDVSVSPLTSVTLSRKALLPALCTIPLPVTWTPVRACAALRHDPKFQKLLHRTRIIDYWNTRGWPPQCKPDGDGARCE
jgi:hypothetical protein